MTNHRARSVLVILQNVLEDMYLYFAAIATNRPIVAYIITHSPAFFVYSEMQDNRISLNDLKFILKESKDINFL